jgi:hypothetical protein
VARAQWTFEIPPAGSDAVGLEEYSVETLEGESLGNVKTVVRHDDGTYVVVESGPPLARTLYAVPWHELDDVDHGAVTVRLARPPTELSSALELDPGKAAEGERAEAVRVTTLPDRLTSASSPDAPGPVDRPSYVLALVLGLLGVFATLSLVAFATATDFTWQFALFVVPAALLALAGVFAYRSYRHQSEAL